MKNDIKKQGKELVKKYPWLFNTLKGIRIVFFYFQRVNLLKTLYYNFYFFSFKQAFKLPLAVGWNVRFRGTGSIILSASEIHPFMLSFGVLKIDDIESNSDKTYISNWGNLEFQGYAKIHPGAKLWIFEDANITFKGNNTIGARSIVASEEFIEIGFNSGCSWDCEIFDTDFHFLIDVSSGEIYPKKKKVFIGDKVFIGNHVNIGKGTKIPNGSVISSWSKVFGSFTRKGENLLIAGNPAKVVDTGLTMTHAYEEALEAECEQKMKNKQRK